MAWVAAGVAAATLVGGAMSADASKSAAKTQAQGAQAATAAQLGMFGQTQANMAPWMNVGQASLAQLASGLGINTNPTGTPNLVDATSGTPRPNAQLYATDPNYKQAWDQVAQAHQQKFQSGYTNNSSADAIQAAVSQLYKPTPSVPNDASNTPGFGQFTKPFTLADFQESPAYQFNLSQGEKAINKAAAARGNYYAPATLQSISKYSQGMASNEFQNAFSNYNTNLNNIWGRLSTMSGAGQNAAGNIGTNATQVAGQVGNNITGAANASAAGQVGSANAINSSMGNAYNAYLMQQILGQNQQSTVPNASPNSAGDYGAFA